MTYEKLQPCQSHLAGLSPVWIRWCRRSAPESLDAYPQPGSWQRYGLTPAQGQGVSEPVKAALGQLEGHERDDAPLWVRMWRLRLLARFDV